MVGTALAIAGGVLELGLSARWFWLLRRVRIPADRRPIMVVHTLALVLGLAALGAGASGLGNAFAGVAVLGAVTFLGLQTMSAQARRLPAVAVGQRIIDFTLPDPQGRPFDLASLRGRPFLLKFFRGHW